MSPRLGKRKKGQQNQRGDSTINSVHLSSSPLNQSGVQEFSKRTWVVWVTLIATIIAIEGGSERLYALFTAGPKILMAHEQTLVTHTTPTDHNPVTLLLFNVTVVNEGNRPLYPERFETEFITDGVTEKGRVVVPDSTVNWGDVQIQNFEDKDLQKVNIIPPDSRVDGYLCIAITTPSYKVLSTNENYVKFSVFDVHNKEYTMKAEKLKAWDDQSENYSFPKAGMKTGPQVRKYH
jgi:hypothetical protein